ncbi:hypothetical protein AKO1_000266 [Acrasis kona]|uniref:histidine kinase n=1 Tax=Acrasis kona TaxID=1008807 RepID=A0AAW2ZFM2_9EUKA
MESMNQLAEVQKKRAQEEEANRRKQEEFIDRVCHEIRNPIQGIMGNCEVCINALAEMADKKSFKQEHIDMLRSSIDTIIVCGQYQRVVTDDVLMLSKLELGKVSLDSQPTNITLLVNNIAAMYAMDMQNKNIEWRCDLDDVKDSIIVIDGFRITTILINLMTNAIKFTNQGSITLKCTLKEMDDHCMLKCSIKDTGRGMSEDEMKHIFNRFMQASQRIYSEYGGSGLGLFITKATVDLMGGTITVNSGEEGGTEFVFTARCKLATDRQKQLVQAVAQVDKSSHQVRNDKVRVLVTEDNKINQRVIVRLLEKCKCTCVTADDGLQAVEKFVDEGPFHMVIMDVVMPRMDGYESTRKMREIEKSRGDGNRVLIVGLSGNTRQEYHNKGIESGMDLFKNKPITSMDLFDLVSGL